MLKIIAESAIVLVQEQSRVEIIDYSTVLIALLCSEHHIGELLLKAGLTCTLLKHEHVMHVQTQMNSAHNGS